MRRSRYDGHPYTPVKTEPLSVATIHGHARTLRAFFSWLVREELAEYNVAKDFKLPKLVKKVVPTLSDEEIGSMLNTLNPNSHSEARDITIFKLLIDTGFRIGELVSLNIVIQHQRFLPLDHLNMRKS